MDHRIVERALVALERALIEPAQALAHPGRDVGIAEQLEGVLEHGLDGVGQELAPDHREALGIDLGGDAARLFLERVDLLQQQVLGERVRGRIGLVAAFPQGGGEDLESVDAHRTIPSRMRVSAPTIEPNCL
ncbi:MAG: hypothetical protein WDO24_30060 [Pseudomonadota bacterium]